MTGYRRPAALALLATVLLAGLSIGPAQADPEPGDNGKLVLVLDSSGSMKEPAGDGRTKIVAARTALTRVVDKLPTDGAGRPPGLWRDGLQAGTARRLHGHPADRADRDGQPAAAADRDREVQALR